MDKYEPQKEQRKGMAKEKDRPDLSWRQSFASLSNRIARKPRFCKQWQVVKSSFTPEIGSSHDSRHFACDCLWLFERNSAAHLQIAPFTIAMRGFT